MAIAYSCLLRGIAMACPYIMKEKMGIIGRVPYIVPLIRTICTTTIATMGCTIMLATMGSLFVL